MQLRTSKCLKPSYQLLSLANLGLQSRILFSKKTDLFFPVFSNHVFHLCQMLLQVSNKNDQLMYNQNGSSQIYVQLGRRKRNFCRNHFCKKGSMKNLPFKWTCLDHMVITCAGKADLASYPFSKVGFYRKFGCKLRNYSTNCYFKYKCTDMGSAKKMT